MAEIIEKTGKSYNIFDKVNNVWNKISFWHKASDCEFDDGKTAQNKLGAINGITSDLTGEAEDIAASIKCVNQLNSSLTNGTNIEEYSFNTSSDVTEDEYTVKHTGWGFLFYQFNKTPFSQFILFINDVLVTETITNGELGNNTSDCIPLFLQKGDKLRVLYYLTYRMNSISLRLRY